MMSPHPTESLWTGCSTTGAKEAVPPHASEIMGKETSQSMYELHALNQIQSKPTSSCTYTWDRVPLLIVAIFQRRGLIFLSFYYLQRSRRSLAWKL